MFEDILTECDLEYDRKFASFLDGGVAADKSYLSINKKASGLESNDITQIIRRGEQPGVLDSITYQPLTFARKSLNPDHAVPQTFSKDSQLHLQPDKKTNMYESKAHVYGGKMHISLPDS